MKEYQLKILTAFQPADYSASPVQNATVRLEVAHVLNPYCQFS